MLGHSDSSAPGSFSKPNDLTDAMLEENKDGDINQVESENIDSEEVTEIESLGYIGSFTVVSNLELYDLLLIEKS